MVAVEDQETEVVAEVVVAEVVVEHSSHQAAADLYFFSDVGDLFVDGLPHHMLGY